MEIAYLSGKTFVRSKTVVRTNMGEITIMLILFFAPSVQGLLKGEGSSDVASAWFVWEKPSVRHWVRSNSSIVKSICSSSLRLHPVGKVAWGLGRMLEGTGAKEANNSVRGLRTYNGTWRHWANIRPPSKQGQPLCLSPARLVPSHHQTLGSSHFLFVCLLISYFVN